MTKNYSADNTALLKILLHSAKYATSSVNGLLLGRVLGGKDSVLGSPQTSPSPGSSGDATVSVLDAIPLGHSFLSLAPVIETALVQVDAFAKENDMNIVGYYHANERLTDLELGPAARKIADRIQQRTPQACIFLLDNKQMPTFLQERSQDFLQVYLKEGSRGWVNGGAALKLGTRSAGLAKMFLELHSHGKHTQLSDFEDHLNDLRRDWTNKDLV